MTTVRQGVLTRYWFKLMTRTTTIARRMMTMFVLSVATDDINRR